MTRKQRVRRNDPCPCGSGKKYKRCCRPQPTITVPSQEISDRQTIPQPMRTVPERETIPEPRREVSEEESAWRRFWDDLEDASPDEKIRMVGEKIDGCDKLDGELAFDLLEAIQAPLQRAGRAVEFDRIIARIEEAHPETFESEAHWMYYWRVQNALLQENGDVGTPLALLARDPQGGEELFHIAYRLRYHGRVRELTRVALEVFPDIMVSPGILEHARWEFRRMAFRLLLDEHLERNPQLPWGDPDFLRESAAVREGMLEDERLERIVAHRSGRAPHHWEPRSFRGPLKKAQGDDLFFLSLDFCAALQGQWGWARSRAELGREVVVEYLWERREERARGKHRCPLKPDPASADKFLASNFHFMGARPYHVAAFTQALGPWMEFLCDLDLMDADDVPDLVRSLESRTRDLPRILEGHQYDPILIEDVRTAWDAAPTECSAVRA